MTKKTAQEAFELVRERILSEISKNLESLNKSSEALDKSLYGLASETPPRAEVLKEAGMPVKSVFDVLAHQNVSGEGLAKARTPSHIMATSTYKDKPKKKPVAPKDDAPKAQPKEEDRAAKPKEEKKKATPKKKAAPKKKADAPAASEPVFGKLIDEARASEAAAAKKPARKGKRSPVVDAIKSAAAKKQGVLPLGQQPTSPVQVTKFPKPPVKKPVMLLTADRKPKDLSPAPQAQPAPQWAQELGVTPIKKPMPKVQMPHGDYHIKDNMDGTTSLHYAKKYRSPILKMIFGNKTKEVGKFANRADAHNALLSHHDQVSAGLIKEEYDPAAKSKMYPTLDGAVGAPYKFSDTEEVSAPGSGGEVKKSPLKKAEPVQIPDLGQARFEITKHGGYSYSPVSGGFMQTPGRVRVENGNTWIHFNPKTQEFEEPGGLHGSNWSPKTLEKIKQHILQHAPQLGPASPRPEPVGPFLHSEGFGTSMENEAPRKPLKKQDEGTGVVAAPKSIRDVDTKASAPVPAKGISNTVKGAMPKITPAPFMQTLADKQRGIAPQPSGPQAPPQSQMTQTMPGSPGQKPEVHNFSIGEQNKGARLAPPAIKPVVLSNPKDVANIREGLAPVTPPVLHPVGSGLENTVVRKPTLKSEELDKAIGGRGYSGAPTPKAPSTPVTPKAPTPAPAAAPAEPRSHDAIARDFKRLAASEGPLDAMGAVSGDNVLDKNTELEKVRPHLGGNDPTSRAMTRDAMSQASKDAATAKLANVDPHPRGIPDPGPAKAARQLAWLTGENEVPAAPSVPGLMHGSSHGQLLNRTELTKDMENLEKEWAGKMCKSCGKSHMNKACGLKEGK